MSRAPKDVNLFSDTTLTRNGGFLGAHDDNDRNLPLSRIRHRANASVVELVCGRLPHACGLALFSRSILQTLSPRREDAVAEAKQSIDRVLSRLNDWLE